MCGTPDHAPHRFYPSRPSTSTQLEKSVVEKLRTYHEVVRVAAAYLAGTAKGTPPLWFVGEDAFEDCVYPLVNITKARAWKILLVPRI